MKLINAIRVMFLSVLLVSNVATAASKAEIDTDVQLALTAFYNLSPGNKELTSKAAGILVFPRIMKAGFLVGGDYGEGALQVAGKTVDYYSTAAISFGLQLGAQSRSEVILFMDKDALDNFRMHDGWAAGIRYAQSTPSGKLLGSEVRVTSHVSHRTEIDGNQTIRPTLRQSLYTLPRRNPTTHRLRSRRQRSGLPWEAGLA